MQNVSICMTFNTWSVVGHINGHKEVICMFNCLIKANIDTILLNKADSCTKF